jgi:hypothetical protein
MTKRFVIDWFLNLGEPVLMTGTSTTKPPMLYCNAWAIRLYLIDL